MKSDDLWAYLEFLCAVHKAHKKVSFVSCSGFAAVVMGALREVLLYFERELRRVIDSQPLNNTEASSISVVEKYPELFGTDEWTEAYIEEFHGKRENPEAD